MNATAISAPLSAALSLFSQIMGALRQVIADHAIPPLTRRGGPVPPMKMHLAEAACQRLRRAESRFRALAERFLAGKLRLSKATLAARRPHDREPRSPIATPQAVMPKAFMPRRFGWLLNETRHLGVAQAHYLRMLLAEPAMRDVLAASPRAGRILAPSCRMLGIETALLTPVARISEASSAVATLPHAEPPAAPAACLPTPPARGNPPPSVPLLVPW